MSTVIVVAGALIVDAKLLVAQRERPPALAGLWELPGGKAGAGETDQDALARELHEELGVDVSVGAPLDAEVQLPGGTLRAYAVTLVPPHQTPQAHDHRALRWVGADELDDVPWVPADRAWLPELKATLSGG